MVKVFLRDTSSQITPKTTFYCFFINKNAQNLLKKVLENFLRSLQRRKKTRFRRFRRRKRAEIPHFFAPSV